MIVPEGRGCPSHHACPTGIDIPTFIRQINTKNPIGSAKTIYDSNYFGYACGKVCPTEVLCEGACVYNLQKVKPIEIGRLQSYATAKAIKSDAKLFTPGKANGKKVAELNTPGTNDELSNRAALRPDGKVFLYQTSNTVHLMDVQTGSEIKTLVFTAFEHVDTGIILLSGEEQ